MSDLLNKMICLVGVEFLSDDFKEENMQEKPGLDLFERKIFPDFDHITVI